MSNAALRIGNNVYTLRQLFGKTIYAARPLTVFNTFNPRSTISHTVSTGDPVGIVRGFIAKGYRNPKSGTVAAQDFLLVGPTNAQIKCVPYAPGNFSETQIRQQGAKSSSEISRSEAEKEAETNQPWYSKLASTLGPWVLVTVAAATFIKSKVK